MFLHKARDSRSTAQSIPMGIPFNDGLRLYVATQNASVTLIYE